ncbi:hypothetical protein GCM10029992_07200 [Glycomyces albus]
MARTDRLRARRPGHPRSGENRRNRHEGPKGRERKAVVDMIGFIVAGLIIGALARLIVPGKQKLGIIATLVLGLVGSVIGGTIANLIGTGDIFELNVVGFIAAVVAAVLLVGVAEGIVQSRHRN